MKPFFENLLTTRQAAEMLGLQPSTVRVYVMAGKIVPAKRFVRMLWFDRREVKRFDATRRPVGNPAFSAAR